MKPADYADVPYGQHILQCMDIYLPVISGKGNAPVIVLIHGGGFYCCDKTDFHIRPAKYFLEMGFAVVSVNYRLAPDFPFPYPVQDVMRAMNWIVKYGGSYGLDTKNLYLHGTSAGGNLAAIAALKYRESPIRAAALLCPVISLDTLVKELKETVENPLESIREIQKIRTQYLGTFPNPAANADFYVSQTSKDKIPFYLQHGDRDGLIPISQSLGFLDVLKSAGWTEVVLDVLTGAPHAGDGDYFFQKEVVERIGNFFKSKCCSSFFRQTSLK